MFRSVDLVSLVTVKTIILYLTREGTTERLFVNGNLVGTATGRSNDYNRQLPFTPWF